MSVNKKVDSEKSFDTQCENLLTGIVKTLEAADPGSGRPRLFFPNGIDLIELHVEVAGAKVEIKISGPPPKGMIAVDHRGVERLAARGLTRSLTEGIDVSHYQKDVDWNKVASAGKRYSYIKATEGASIVDDYFSQNWNGAKGAGVLRGAYHFFVPSSDVDKQVKNFVTTVGQLEDTDMPPALDLEQRTGWDSTPIDKRPDLIQRWLQPVQAALKCRPTVYTSKSFMDEILGGSTALASYPLWVVDYSNATPNLPDGWADWTFWQFSETGSCDGVSGDVDLDHFSGDYTQLQNFIMHQHSFVGA